LLNNRKEQNTEVLGTREGACSCSHDPGFGALAGPAFGARLPLPLPIHSLLVIANFIKVNYSVTIDHT
jgi:hypothetical protein